jgi:signal transduction histidine kinase
MANNFRSIVRWSGVVLVLVAPAAAGAVLTNAIQVLSLPGEQAWGKEVLIRGVVTAAQPSTASRTNWAGKFFVQDATAGVFAEDSAGRQPAPGDFVEVKGTSHPGGFAPFISYASWTKLGTAELPEAKLVPIEQLMAGIEDSQRVEISGIIRSFRDDMPLVIYDVASGGFRLSVFAPPVAGIANEDLIGARVRVRGTASTFYSWQLRQLITVELHVPAAADFVIEKAPPGDPFAAPVLPLNRLGQYHQGRDLGERVHVKGMLTYQRPGEDLFLQDATSGLQVRSRQLTRLNPGDIVEAVGFLVFDQYLPVLEDAVFRKSPDTREALQPKSVAIWELKAGYRHADLIKLQGKVLERVETRASETDASQADSRTILTLQNSGIVFTVEAFTPEPNQALALVPIGSTVEAVGICFMYITEEGNLQALQLLLPEAGDLRLLHKPNWLTPPRLLAGLTILGVVLVIAFTWIVMIQKKNSALKMLIQEKSTAQQELQQSHDLLEWRVAERTKQLQFEMTARKEAEVSFKATLAERTRLAQELHDTLEQSLTGIGLQVDTAGKLLEKDPAAGNRHLGLARNLMTQTQVELRRSIWDLRSRELEEFDFPNALRVNAQHLTEGTKLTVEIETTGPKRPLSEVTEENLLRISQAALTNVIKHAEATEAKIRLQFRDPDVTLAISDNGRGFNPQDCPGSAEGHFGLLGISERVKRLDGKLQVTSVPGGGTTLEVQVPIRLPSARPTPPPIQPPHPP